MKKHFSGLMALLLLLTLCAGCGNSDPGRDNAETPQGVYYDLTGIDPQETVMEYDGNTVPAEMYFYWLGYSCADLEYTINMYNAYYGGAYSHLVDEDGNLIWDGDLEGTTPSQAAKEEADYHVMTYVVLENMAKEYGVTLTDEDRASMEADIAQQVEQFGGEEGFQASLDEAGIGRETFERLFLAPDHLLDHLRELAADPACELYAEPSEEDNAYVDHILITTVDTTTGESYSEEEIASRRATAEDLLAQLQAAGDVEALFNELVEEYGEDPGRATDAGYLVTPQTNFVQEFLDAAFSLKPGELSGIVESSYGYHIMLRKELTEDQRTSLLSSHLTDLLGERCEAALAEVVRSEKLDGVDAGDFYTRYMEILDQLQDQGTDAGGSDGGAAE